MLGGEPNSRFQGCHSSTLMESKGQTNGKGQREAKPKYAFGLDRKLHTENLDFKCGLNPWKQGMGQGSESYKFVSGTGPCCLQAGAEGAPSRSPSTCLQP